MKKLFILMSIILLLIIGGCAPDPGNITTDDGTAVITEDYLMQVAKGNIEGAYLVHKFGANGAVGSTLEPITTTGFYRTPQTAASLEILSSDADDDVAGLGARKVMVIGLNASGHQVSEEVSLDGTTPVTLTNTYLRIYRAYVTESGTYATQSLSSQQGIITIRGVGGGQTWAQIDNIAGFGVGQTEIGVYTIPKGYECYLLKKVMSVNSVKAADLYFFQKQNITKTTAPYAPVRLVEKHIGVQGVQEINSRSSITMFPELTDVGFMGKSSTSAEISVEFELLCESIN